MYYRYKFEIEGQRLFEINKLTSKLLMIRRVRHLLISCVMTSQVDKLGAGVSFRGNLRCTNPEIPALEKLLEVVIMLILTTLTRQKLFNSKI